MAGPARRIRIRPRSSPGCATETSARPLVEQGSIISPALLLTDQQHLDPGAAFCDRPLCDSVSTHFLPGQYPNRRRLTLFIPPSSDYAELAPARLDSKHQVIIVRLRGICANDTGSNSAVPGKPALRTTSQVRIGCAIECLPPLPPYILLFADGPQDSVSSSPPPSGLYTIQRHPCSVAWAEIATTVKDTAISASTTQTRATALPEKRIPPTRSP